MSSRRHFFLVALVDGDVSGGNNDDVDEDDSLSCERHLNDICCWLHGHVHTYECMSIPTITCIKYGCV